MLDTRDIRISQRIHTVTLRVDSVILVVDSVKGVEEQTRKLMDVCKNEKYTGNGIL